VLGLSLSLSLSLVTRQGATGPSDRPLLVLWDQATDRLAGTRTGAQPAFATWTGAQPVAPSLLSHIDAACPASFVCRAMEGAERTAPARAAALAEPSGVAAAGARPARGRGVRAACRQPGDAAAARAGPPAAAARSGQAAWLSGGHAARAARLHEPPGCTGRARLHGPRPAARAADAARRPSRAGMDFLSTMAAPAPVPGRSSLGQAGPRARATRRRRGPGPGTRDWPSRRCTAASRLRLKAHRGNSDSLSDQLARCPSCRGLQPPPGRGLL
jgi:hypothetical protein